MSLNFTKAAEWGRAKEGGMSTEKIELVLKRVRAGNLAAVSDIDSALAELRILRAAAQVLDENMPIIVWKDDRKEMMENAWSVMESIAKEAP